MGDWFIDTSLTLTNCKVYTGTNAHIFVLTDDLLILDSSTTIMGCLTMWRGIKLEYGSAMQMKNNSIVADGAPGVFVTGEANSFLIQNSKLIDCATVIYVDPCTSGGYHTLYDEIYESEIGLRNGFKPNYGPSQPAHGTYAETEIELHDMASIYIGDDGQQPNLFYFLSPGVEGLLSDAILPAQIADRCATLGLPEGIDDLLFGES